MRLRLERALFDAVGWGVALVAWPTAVALYPFALAAAVVVAPGARLTLELGEAQAAALAAHRAAQAAREDRSA